MLKIEGIRLEPGLESQLRRRVARILHIPESELISCRLLRRSGLPVEAVRDWRAALASAEGAPVVGIGNIKGQAADMVAHFERGGSEA